MTASKQDQGKEEWTKWQENVKKKIEKEEFYSKMLALLNGT